MADPLCPICSKSLTHLKGEQKLINEHIDECLTLQEVYSGGIQSQDVDEGYDYNPFGLTCPYPHCSKVMQAKLFVDHILQVHAKASSHAYSCPICSLGGDEYQVTQSTNLLSHIQKIHADLMGKSSALNVADLKSSLLTSAYLDEILASDINKECPICYETFQRGQAAARLQCFCLYHKVCIDDWFSRKDVKECPLHKS
eukprot:TRINITY_DN10912_c0_g1_i1.p1 TRINITY_DN10912_c0_g1~~TRINITY_DN10912_c0_g1_i1.p1  ORF type:complete len:199 (-),score=14.03 TRINITY_DN10912_c0_g1_i1:82-678(-)